MTSEGIIMKFGFLRTLGLAGAVVLGAASARATAVPVYSDFGKGESYDQTNGYYVAGPTSLESTAFWPAAPFTPTKSGKLDYIDVALANADPIYSGSGYIGALVSVTRDSRGLPGATLETWVVTKEKVWTATTSPKIPATKLVSTTHPELTASTQYWVLVQPLGLDTFGIWMFNSVGVTTTSVDSSNGGSTWTSEVGSGYAQPAFDVWEE